MTATGRDIGELACRGLAKFALLQGGSYITTLRSGHNGKSRLERNSVKYSVKLCLLPGLMAILGCGVVTPHSNEQLAFPAATGGADAPRFIQGDPAQAQAAAGPNDWVLAATVEKADYVVKDYVPKGAA
jgi:hypothetical protein